MRKNKPGVLDDPLFGVVLRVRITGTPNQIVSVNSIRLGVGGENGAQIFVDVVGLNQELKKCLASVNLVDLEEKGQLTF